MNHAVCPYCGHKAFTSIRDGKSCKKCGQKIESVELSSLTDIVLFPGACTEPAVTLDRYMIDIPEYGNESARRAVALAKVADKARSLGANGVYSCRIISQSNLAYFREKLGLDKVGFLSAFLGRSRLPAKIECGFAKLDAESFRKEKNRFQLTLMSRNLRSAGIASIIWGVLNMWSLGTYSWSNLGSSELVVLILSYALIAEGIVLLVRRRPGMFVLDGMTLCALGIANIGTGLISTAGVSYLGREPIHFGFAIGLGLLQIFWGCGCFFKYRKVKQIWQAVIKSLDAAGANRERILERQIMGK